jgi:hypothetical protein
MMSLQPLELRDYHLAGRYQHVAVLVGKGARQKSLGEGRSATVSSAGSQEAATISR